MRSSLLLEELKEIYHLRSLLFFWGWLDVRQKYRNSVLGPFWVTVTMGISIFATGFVYAFLFKQDVSVYLPYVAVGFVMWSFITGYIGEACSVFIQNEAFLTQIRLPLLIYPLRLLWRYVVIFLHHLVVLLTVLLVFSKVSIVGLLAFLLGFFVLSLNIFWMGTFLGLLSVRLRDLPILISTAFQVLFMITPVIWPVSALGSRMKIANINPFYHFLEVVRAPLMGNMTAAWELSLLFSFVFAIFGLALVSFLIIIWKRMLVFWL